MVVVIVALLAAETVGVSERKAAIAGLAMSAIFRLLRIPVRYLSQAYHYLRLPYPEPDGEFLPE